MNQDPRQVTLSLQKMSSDQETEISQAIIQEAGVQTELSSPAPAPSVGYKTLTSHGHEAVSGAVRQTVISRYPGEAWLTPYEWKSDDWKTQHGRVHIPIHNPHVASTIHSLIVNIRSERGGSVLRFVLYYDSTVVFTKDVKTKNAFRIDFNPDEAKKAAYLPPKGISVQLILKFPEAESCVKLVSVALLCKDK